MDLIKIPYEHQFSQEWKLKKSELLKALSPSSTTKNGLLFSSQYSASKIAGVNYWFALSPYGQNEKNAGETRIYLHFALGNVKEVKAKYQVSIKSANFLETFEHVYKENVGYEFMHFKADEFFDPAKKYFVNDECDIKFEGTLKFDRPLISKTSHLISTKWTIKVADLEPLKTSLTNDCLESEIFGVPSNSNIKYHLHFYPNGYNKEKAGKAFIGLCIEFEDSKKISTSITFAINSGIWSKALYACYENSDDGCGFVICSTDDFFDVKNGYVVDGEMVITVEGHLFVEKKNLRFELMDDEINGERIVKENNFKIIVDQDEIEVSKELLANVSTVWAGMLQSGMKESIEGKMEITDFSFKVVDDAIKLIYGISPNFTLDDMLPLLVFADKYDIKLIKELVEDHLISELAPSNVCQLIHFSHLFNAKKLYEKSVEFFLQCSHEKTSVNDLDILDKELVMKIFYATFPSISY